MKYRIYIDETGNADLGSSDNPNHRFLSLTGVIVSLAYAHDVLQPEIEALKHEFFDSHADDPVVLHRKDMVNRRGRFLALKDPEVEDAFNARLLARLQHWEYQVLTVLMDKKEHAEKYQTWKFDPYHYCLAVLMERYFFFLDHRNARGDVMIESRGTNLDRRLSGSFRGLMESGTEFIQAECFQRRFTSKEIKIRAKHFNVAGLQLADLLAHPSRRDILHRLGLLQVDAPTPARIFGDRIIGILAGKYEQYNGEVMGSGLKKLP